jgi:hypothetical protein
MITSLSYGEACSATIPERPQIQQVPPLEIKEISAAQGSQPTKASRRS